MRALLPATLLAVLLAAGSARALDPAQPLAHAQHHAWRSQQGLPQNTVAALAQGPDEHLYLGTQEGLVRFDGVTWEVWNTARGLPCNDVTALHAARDGSLFIGTRGCGLVRRVGERFVKLPSRPGLRDNRVQAFLATRDGTLWVGTNHGLARWTGAALAYVPGLDAQDVNVQGLAEDPDGSVWVGTQLGLARVVGGRVERPAGAPGPTAREVSAVRVDAAGVLWVGTVGEGLWRREGARWLREPGVPAPRISALFTDRHGVLWVGTDGQGLWRRRAGRFEPLTLDGLGRSDVRSLLEDREGTLWVGTYSDGVHQLRDRRVEPVGVPEGLSDDVAWAVAETRDGAVWLGTDGGGLHRYQGGRVTHRYTAQDGLPPGSVYGVVEDPRGALWVATSAGLGRLEGGRWRRYTVADGLPTNTLFTVFVDRHGTLWAGGDRALVQVADGRVVSYGRQQGVSGSGVHVILDAPGGGLWLGTPSGLEHFRDGRVRPVPLSGAPEGDPVSALAHDRDAAGVLWVGTTRGLYRLDGRGARVVRARDGLYDDNVISVVDDGRGNLWMASNKGLFRVAKAALDAFLDGRAPRVQSVSYGVADGMRSAECNSAGNSSSLRTRSGELWFPTVAGAVRVLPERALQPAPPVPLVIQKVTSEGEPVDLSRGLSGDAPHVEFAYAALTFVDPEKVRYRYRLEGFDQGWVEAGARRQAFYTNLPPGEYRFRVQAVGADGVLLPHEAEVRFARHPRPWERPECWGVVGLLGSALSVLLFRLRVRRLRARERALTARVEERTRALAQANAELLRAAAESRESEASLRRLVDQLPNALCIFQHERGVYANAAAMSLLGYEALEDFLGTEFMAYVPPEERMVTRARVLQVEQGHATTMLEAKVVRRDGSVGLVESCLVPIAYGGRPALVVVARDVTEARQLEARLRLSDRMASVGTLAAGVAHEINNPLAYVVANLRFVAEEVEALRQQGTTARAPGEVDALLRDAAEALSEARHGADRVKHIVRDLKTFSRGGDEENLTAVDVRPVLESALSMGHNEVRHRARLRKELGAVPLVMANEARLGQVFLNLVVNAAQAIREGAADQNEIAVRTFTDEAGRAVVEVQDTGSGIAPENLKRIWDPFFTTKPVGVGTGLGLSICHNLVTTLGGDIRVESVLGQGTTFRVVLPAAARTGATAQATAVPGSGDRGQGPRARLLVVDDEPLVAKSLVRLLGGGHAVEAETSARVALERIARGERFDLVFCDVMMPEMGGQDFWEALGSVAPEQRERMVFITGGAFTAEARAFLESVPNRTFGKPFEPETLRELVREWMAAPTLQHARA